MPSLIKESERTVLMNVRAFVSVHAPFACSVVLAWDAWEGVEDRQKEEKAERDRGEHPSAGRARPEDRPIPLRLHGDR